MTILSPVGAGRSADRPADSNDRARVVDDVQLAVGVDAERADVAEHGALRRAPPCGRACPMRRLRRLRRSSARSTRRGRTRNRRRNTGRETPRQARLPRYTNPPVTDLPVAAGILENRICRRLIRERPRHDVVVRALPIAPSVVAAATRRAVRSRSLRNGSVRHRAMISAPVPPRATSSNVYRHGLRRPNAQISSRAALPPRNGLSGGIR